MVKHLQRIASTLQTSWIRWLKKNIPRFHRANGSRGGAQSPPFFAILPPPGPFHDKIPEQLPIQDLGSWDFKIILIGKWSHSFFNTPLNDASYRSFDRS